MPFGDGTGPAGWGPMTGRAAGFCAGYPVPGYMNPGPAFGFWGRGRGFGGRGRGWRHWYYATGLPGWARAGMFAPYWGAPVWGSPPPYAPQMTQEQQADALKAQAEHLESTLQEIRQRIEDLEQQQSES